MAFCFGSVNLEGGPIINFYDNSADFLPENLQYVHLGKYSLENFLNIPRNVKHLSLSESPNILKNLSSKLYPPLLEKLDIGYFDLSGTYFFPECLTEMEFSFCRYQISNNSLIKLPNKLKTLKFKNSYNQVNNSVNMCEYFIFPDSLEVLDSCYYLSNFPENLKFLQIYSVDYSQLPVNTYPLKLETLKLYGDIEIYCQNFIDNLIGKNLKIKNIYTTYEIYNQFIKKYKKHLNLDQLSLVVNQTPNIKNDDLPQNLKTLRLSYYTELSKNPKTDIFPFNNLKKYFDFDFENLTFQKVIGNNTSIIGTRKN